MLFSGDVNRPLGGGVGIAVQEGLGDAAFDSAQAAWQRWTNR
ncbi:hypothetical protein [Leptothoe kymatousa]|nr:hypothetical protein [Leptothoe kymatousa]